MTPLIQTLATIFFFAFLLNAVWEHIHALLYVHYKGAVITTHILLRAALFDAALITTAAALFLHFGLLDTYFWLFITLLIVFAIGLEIWALKTNRWAYTQYMPLIPFIHVGITPSAQLGLLATIAVLISRAPMFF